MYKILKNNEIVNYDVNLGSIKELVVDYLNISEEEYLNSLENNKLNSIKKRLLKDIFKYSDVRIGNKYAVVYHKKEKLWYHVSLELDTFGNMIDREGYTYEPADMDEYSIIMCDVSPSMPTDVKYNTYYGNNIVYYHIDNTGKRLYDKYYKKCDNFKTYSTEENGEIKAALVLDFDSQYKFINIDGVIIDILTGKISNVKYDKYRYFKIGNYTVMERSIDISSNLEKRYFDLLYKLPDKNIVVGKIDVNDEITISTNLPITEDEKIKFINTFILKYKFGLKRINRIKSNINGWYDDYVRVGFSHKYGDRFKKQVSYNHMKMSYNYINVTSENFGKFLLSKNHVRLSCYSEYDVIVGDHDNIYETDYYKIKSKETCTEVDMLDSSDLKIYSIWSERFRLYENKVNNQKGIIDLKYFNKYELNFDDIDLMFIVGDEVDGAFDLISPAFQYMLTNLKQNTIPGISKIKVLTDSIERGLLKNLKDENLLFDIEQVNNMISLVLKIDKHNVLKYLKCFLKFYNNIYQDELCSVLKNILSKIYNLELEYSCSTRGKSVKNLINTIILANNGETDLYYVCKELDKNKTRKCMFSLNFDTFGQKFNEDCFSKNSTIKHNWNMLDSKFFTRTTLHDETTYVHRDMEHNSDSYYGIIYFDNGIFIGLKDSMLDIVKYDSDKKEFLKLRSNKPTKKDYAKISFGHTVKYSKVIETEKGKICFHKVIKDLIVVIDR